MKQGYLPTEMCTQCGGLCCKSYPGTAWPEDVLVLTNQNDLEIGLHELLSNGKWAIDWWEGDPREDKNTLYKCYFLRPATKDCNKIFDPAWGGECVFLSPSGCLLSDTKRPYQCRALKPKNTTTGECRLSEEVDKRHGALAWLDHQETLERIGREIQEKKAA